MFMKIRARIAAASFVALFAAPAALADDYTSLYLWPDGAPGALASEEKDKPRITVHLPDKDKATGTAVVVNPGGGYRGLAADHEGLQVAKELNRHGIAAFVLRYRLRPDYQPSIALEDAKRALRYVRHNAEEYGVDKERIGMMGFSAGGHLTSAAGTMWDKGDPEAKDPIDRESSRPDFIAPVYAVINRDLVNFDMGDYASTNKLVTAETPPTFLVQTSEDTTVIATHSLQFYQACLEKGVPAEMHIFQFGPHGLGLAPGDPSYGEWPSLMVKWLQRNGLLTGEKRIPITGSVTMDGKPLVWGSLTLDPVDPALPVVFLPVRGGKFTLDEKHGPCPGKYRVIVYENASDSKQMMSGQYTMDDAKRFDLPEPVEMKAGSAPLDIALTSK